MEMMEGYYLLDLWAEHQVGSDKDTSLVEAEIGKEGIREPDWRVRPNFNDHQKLKLDFIGNSTEKL